MSENVLVGKTLTGIKIREDKEAILFQTTDGAVVALADGDCCSHSWVESIELPALGFPALVTEARDLDLVREEEEVEPDEVIQFYGFKIVTDKGEIVIDYRNSSNGYYGGCLLWPDEPGRNAGKMDWQDVKP